MSERGPRIIKAAGKNTEEARKELKLPERVPISCSAPRFENNREEKELKALSIRPKREVSAVKVTRVGITVLTLFDATALGYSLANEDYKALAIEGGIFLLYAVGIIIANVYEKDRIRLRNTINRFK